MPTRPMIIEESLPKLSEPLEQSILDKLGKVGKTLKDFVARGAVEMNIYYSRKGGTLLDFVPKVVDSAGKLRPPAETKAIAFNDRSGRQHSPGWKPGRPSPNLGRREAVSPSASQCPV